MVPFAGYEMPVQYPAGILKEHLHTREKAGLFDVSHMGQAFLVGDDPAARAGSADARRCAGPEGRQAALRAAAEPDGGTIKDDFMFSRLAGEPALYLVVNAATKEGDFAYIAEKLKGSGSARRRSHDRALLALQGPAAEAVLERHSPGIDSSPS